MLRITIALLAMLCCQPAHAGDWSHYGATAASTKFAPLDQIDSTNVNQVRMIWRWRAPDVEIYESGEEIKARSRVNQATPLAIDGTLYTITPLNVVVALDGATGQERWRFDPEAWRVPTPHGVSRGVAYWRDGDKKRVVFGTSSGYLYALDAETGRPDPAFGDQGRIDLTKDLQRPIEDRAVYGVTSPPIVCRDIIVVGGYIKDWHDDSPEIYPPGDVRGYDIRTGALRWTFHTVPQPGEFGYDTWPPDAWQRYGGANAWSMMSADRELGYVYLPLSSPSNDAYGGGRHGDNLFGQSLVCIKAETGERVWHYQTVHHPLWNYDLPAAPILLDLEVDGRPVKAVAQITKQGFVFAFDRITGEPLWPIEERPVPASTVPGERASPTQPFPTKPAPVDRQGLHPDDLIDFTPELRRQALELIERYDYGPLYTPPSERGAINIPGAIGGADWVGGAAHPEKGWLYIPSKSHPNINEVHAQDPDSPDPYLGPDGRWLPHTESALPILKPPYGRMTAIDLNTGEHRWMVPLGEGPRNHPALKDLNLPPLGWETRHFVLATPPLLFSASEYPLRYSWYDHDYFIDSEMYVRALNLADGREMGRIDLPENAQGNPMTYMAGGRQFIVVPIGLWDLPSELVALALPRPDEKLPPQGLLRDDADHPAYYPALTAIDTGDLDGLQRLLQAHPELATARGFLNAGNMRDATLLHHIAGHLQRVALPPNIVAITRALLDAGSDPNARTQAEETPLLLLLQSAQPRWLGVHLELMRLVLEAGADPNYNRGQPLWQVVFDDRTEEAEFLLARGAELHLHTAAALNLLDRLPSFFDADRRLRPMAKAHYRPRADIDTTWTDQVLLDEALSYASRAGHIEAAALLLERGAQINAIAAVLYPNEEGSTALHKAANESEIDMVRFLLEQGADPQIRDVRWNASVRDWAHGDELTKLLEEAAQPSSP